MRDKQYLDILDRRLLQQKNLVDKENNSNFINNLKKEWVEGGLIPKETFNKAISRYAPGNLVIGLKDIAKDAEAFMLTKFELTQVNV